MARNVTLTTLRERVRWRADIMNEIDRFPVSEVDDCINEGIAQFHAELVRLYGQGFGATSTFVTTSPGVEVYALPAAFLQLMKVWTIIDGSERVLRTYETFDTDGMRDPVSWSGVVQLNYRLQGDNISFRQKPDNVHIVHIQYVPSAVKLTEVGHTLDGIDGFEEFVIQWAVSLIAQKNRDWELDQNSQSKAGQVLDRIRAVHTQRNAAEPARMQDVRAADRWSSYGFRRRWPLP